VKHIGYFDDFREAVKARKAAEMQMQYHKITEPATDPLSKRK
jgi:hypothetical protein